MLRQRAFVSGKVSKVNARLPRHLPVPERCSNVTNPQTVELEPRDGGFGRLGLVRGVA
jgi:hypothetical protein